MEITFILIILLLAIGIVLSIVGTLRISRSKAASNFPKSQARIKHSSIASLTIPHSAGLTCEYFYPVIEFEYSFNNISYTSKTVAYDIKSIATESNDEIQLLINMLANNNNMAYINPNKPYNAYIFPSLSKERRSHFLSMAIGGLLIIFIACGLLLIT
jgi:hypothetical protein